jgi:hypothetical protein
MRTASFDVRFREVKRTLSQHRRTSELDPKRSSGAFTRLGYRPTSARTSRTLFCDGHHMTKVLPALGSNPSDGQYDRQPPGGNRLPANLEAGPDERVAPLVGVFFQVASSPGWSHNRPCHRWHTAAVGSSRQTCASPSCCRYRATTKSASRAARTIQMLTRMTNTPANRVAVRQLGGAALYSSNEGLGTLAGDRATPPVALGIADRAFAKS